MAAAASEPAVLKKIYSAMQAQLKSSKDVYLKVKARIWP